jgi:uncharacterized surface protein with fasciclin (FAS1) repeats
MMAKTAGGNERSLKIQGSSVMVDNTRVVKTDLAASNAIIHVINTVGLLK